MLRASRNIEECRDAPHRTGVDINGARRLALAAQGINMQLVQTVELALLCCVHWVIPLVIALDSECVEKLLVMVQSRGFFRVAASFNKALESFVSCTRTGAALRPRRSAQTLGISRRIW